MPRRSIDIDSLSARIIAGDRLSLSRGITLLESQHRDDKPLARELVDRCLSHSGHSIRMGITGSPGVGKSTFIEQLGLHLIEEGKQPAVLAIDPSSSMSKGSILGDKTRMGQLAQMEKAYIRPSSTGGTLGGVTRSTRESIILCEAAGYDTILIETVGVGQSETAVYSMSDVFLLLLLPGAGDELQGIKRGIVEMADFLIIHKADGERKNLAEQSRKDYRHAITLLGMQDTDGWKTPIHAISSLERVGFEDLWKDILEFEELMKASGRFDAQRKEQNLQWLDEALGHALMELFFSKDDLKIAYEEIKTDIRTGRISPFHAADRLIETFRSQMIDHN